MASQRYVTQDDFQVWRTKISGFVDVANDNLRKFLSDVIEERHGETLEIIRGLQDFMLERFDAINEQFALIDQRFAAIEKRQDAFERRLEKVEKASRATHRKVDNVEKLMLAVVKHLGIDISQIDLSSE